MQMLSLAAALIAEAVVHFDNGMIGAITKGGKIALVDKAGVSTKAKYMPLVEDYLAVNSPIMIEHTFRIGKDEYYHETVWVDDEWDFENKCWDFSIMDAGAEQVNIEATLYEIFRNSNFAMKDVRLVA